MKRQISLLFIIASLILFFLDLTTKMQAQEREPIAFIGHGAFFDQDGKQIELTQEFVANAQNWYRTKLLSSLKVSKKAEYAQIERGLSSFIDAEGQDRLLVRQYLLDLLVTNSQDSTRYEQFIGKINALRYVMRWKLPNRAEMHKFKYNENYKLNSEIERKLELFKLGLFKLDIEKKLKSFTPSFNSSQLFSDNIANGDAYRNKCKDGGVPIPPSIGIIDSEGKKGWKSLGFIPCEQQFVGQTPAELLVFQCDKGLCMALLRYSGDKKTVTNSGVICLGTTSSNACFWDNQNKNEQFDFPTGSVVPIGIPNTGSKYYLGGADELDDSFKCTDCHAGQNPFIIHPKVKLKGGSEMGQLNLPTFSQSSYIPLVKPTWPQNQPAEPTQPVPSMCASCHSKDGEGGAFPRLTGLTSYCRILEGALKKTMPVGNEGVYANYHNFPELENFMNLCKPTNPFRSMALSGQKKLQPIYSAKRLRKSRQPPRG